MGIQFGKVKKTLAILLAVFFVVSLTAASASAGGFGWGKGKCGGCHDKCFDKCDGCGWGGGWFGNNWFGDGCGCKNKCCCNSGFSCQFISIFSTSCFNSDCCDGWNGWWN